ncbi:hypothetical protein Aperf_G00000064729 [Anoplocephala perfoliata]
MNTLTTTLLRSWVFLMWNMQQIIEYIRGKRSVFIPINDLRIIYNNDGLLVVDKSHELLINSNNSWFNCVTLQMQIFFAFPRLANFGLEHMFWFVHRLDAPTSGLICIAYSQKMASLAGKAFQDRATKKHYLAVVWGHVQDSSVFDESRKPMSNYFPLLSVDSSWYSNIISKVGNSEYLVRFAIGDYLIEWSGGRKQKIMMPNLIPDCWRPRLAETKITVLKHGYLEGSPASLLLLQPHSGRRHQLRLHCALGLRGHPIAGDLIYGRLFGEEATVQKDHALPRLMLHAYSLHIQLVPKPPYVKGMKKQERVNRSHPEPVELKFKSNRDLFCGCHWIDYEVFHQIGILDG